MGKKVATVEAQKRSLTIPIAKIEVGERMREINQDAVQAIASSMDDIGQLQPIRVARTNNGKYRLVFGAHRIAAAELLGWDSIGAEIVTMEDLDRRLAEIDENLVRADLQPLEEALHSSERKTIYLAKHPETKKGGTPGAGRGKGKRRQERRTPSFVQDTVEKTGKSPSTVQNNVRVGDALKSVASRLRGTEVSKNKESLLALAVQKQRDPKLFGRIVDKVSEKRDLSLSEAVRQIRNEDHPVSPFPPGPFSVIYANPVQMSTAELCGLDVRSLAAPNSVLFLWSPVSWVEDALAVARAWGFEYRTAFVWKKNHAGEPGAFHRENAELVLVATRGDFLPEAQKRSTQVFEAISPGGGRKPDVVLKLIDYLYPEGPRVELFAGKPANVRWQAWNNEPSA